MLKLFHKSLPGVFAFSVALQVASLSFALPPLLAIDRFFEYALFFALGFAFIEHYETVVAFVLDRVLLFSCLFAFSFLSILVWSGAGSKTLIGICSLPALYAFSVYLMNTLFIGITKGVLQNFLSWDDTNFLLFFPTLLTVGVIGPVVLHRYALARIPYLGKITK